MTSADWYYGLPRTLDNIHRVASLTRDRLSLEAWRTLNDFYASRRWRADAMPTAMGDSLRLLDDGLRVLAAFHGLTHENMTRNFGWSFLDMGRRLSRGLQPVRAAARHLRQGQARRRRDRQACCSSSSSPTASSPIARATGMAPMLPLVLDLLLIDESNPRSIAFQLAALSRHIDTLPQSGEARRPHRGATHGAVPADAGAARRRRRSSPRPRPDGARSSLQKLLERAGQASLPLPVGRRSGAATSISSRRTREWVRARSRMAG